MTFTDKETATIIAALRYWQAEAVYTYRGDVVIRPTACNQNVHFEEVDPLTPNEIDSLCVKINTEE